MMGIELSASSLDIADIKTVDFFERHIFPLVAETNRSFPTPLWIMGIQFFIVILQVFFGCLFFLCPDIQFHGILAMLIQVFYFGIWGDVRDNYPFFFIIFMLDLVGALFFFGVIIDCHYRHEYKKWTLAIIGAWHRILFQITVIPNVVIFFLSFSLLARGKDIISVVIVIFACLAMAYTLFHTLYLAPLLLGNPYLAKIPVFYYRPLKSLRALIFTGIPIGISGLTQVFSSWTYYIPCFCMIIPAYLFIDCGLSMILSATIVNACLVSLGISMVLLTFMSGIQIPQWFNIPAWSLFLVLGAFVGIAIFFNFYFRNKMRVIAYKLSNSAYEEANEQNPSTKGDYLMSLKLDPFIAQQIGLVYHCDLFLDWSLSKALVHDNMSNNELLLFATWMTSFFPSEIHVLHAFIMMANKMKSPTIPQRAMYFQLHRIHIFRQSSASKEANNDYGKVRSLTNKCIMLYHDFWIGASQNSQHIDTEIFAKIGATQQQAEACWAEFLDKYPNNSRFAREYSRYLLDARCHYHNAIKWRNKAAALDSGAHLKNDHLFHCFVTCFPMYLKEGIVDTKGNLRVRKMLKTGLSASSSQISTSSIGLSSGSSVDSSRDDSDFNEINNDGFVPQAQLRLALERAIAQLRSKTLASVHRFDLIAFIVIVIYLVIVMIVFASQIEDEHVLYKQVASLNEAQQIYDILNVQIMWKWATGGSIDITAYSDALGDSFDSYPYYINREEQDDLLTIHNLTQMCMRHLNSAASMFYSNSGNGGTISDYIDTYANTPLEYHICDDTGAPLDEARESTVDFIFRTSLYSADLLTLPGSDYTQWATSRDMCNFYNARLAIVDGFKMLAETLSPTYQSVMSPAVEGDDDDEEEEEEEEEEEGGLNLSDLFLGLSPFLVFLFTMPPIIFQSAGLYSERDRLMKVLCSFSSDECIKASESLQEDILGGTDEDTANVIEAKRNAMPSWIIEVVYALIIIALLIAMIILCDSLKSKSNILIEQFAIMTELRTLGYQGAIEAILAVFIHDQNIVAEFADAKELSEASIEHLNQFRSTVQLFTAGNDEMDPAVGFDDRLDSLLLDPRCESNFEKRSIIDYYACLPFYRMMLHFSDGVRQVASTYETRDVASPGSLILINYLQSHLAFGFDNLSRIYTSIAADTVSFYKLMVIVICVVAIILTILNVIIEFIFSTTSARELEILKGLMLRLNPVAFVANQDAIGLVYGSNKESEGKTIASASHAIFFTTPDAMISLNTDGIIEALNPAATKIFGFTPEQMLGQAVKLIINPEIGNNNQLFTTMQLMKSGQTGLVFQQEIMGTKDDGNDVPLRVNLLGLSNNGRTAESFALMCKDQTEEVRQKTLVEGAKSQSEYLLFQILPRDIITMLNRGDQNISFTVPSASIIFIDIVQFSTYMATLSAMELMSNLGMVFTTYDKLIGGFPLLTKIKLIGDDYMAAGGLFSTDGNPADHANQMLMFALQVLNAIEKLNIELNASLQVRVGINSGGPLIAGVLGTDKPLFDIIGDPINVAARLQTTDVPGLIQISQGTYDLVANGPYKIEQRGEIELKGKGKQMTYLVYPDHNLPLADGTTPTGDGEAPLVLSSLALASQQQSVTLASLTTSLRLSNSNVAPSNP